MEFTEKNGPEQIDEELIPWYVTGITAYVCAAALIIMASLGPLGMGVIQYRFSQSGIWQMQGNDLANIFVIVPALLIGGTLQLLRKGAAKYFLVLTPITLMYTGLMVGTGNEWSDPSITGNVQNFFLLFLVLIIGGLFLLISSLSMFTKADAPNFEPKKLRLFAVLSIVFLTMFAWMWLSQIIQVINTGDLPDGSYSAAPTSFWVIRYLDLGISIPVGFLALFMMLSKPKRAYRLVLLFLGFFVTMAAAVNGMALIQVMNNDPALGSVGAGIAIFPILGALAFAQLYFMVGDKFTRRAKGRARAGEANDMKGPAQ